MFLPQFLFIPKECQDRYWTLTSPAKITAYLRNY
jgi:hypothetical protein